MQMCFPAVRCEEDDRRRTERCLLTEGESTVLSSPVIDLAIGLTFVFGVTAALASLLTELIARAIGLRGAYLLSGLRELLDGGQKTDLNNAETDYGKMKQVMLGATIPPHEPPDEQRPSSITGALLGGPILSNQGIAGQFSSRKLTLEKTTGTGRLPKITADRTPDPESGQKPGGLRSQLRSLPSYISARSFGEAVIDLVVPDAAGQTTMGAIQDKVDALPDSISPLKPSLQALVKEAGGDISRFRTSLEKWYDDHMDRVSGWYKRYVAVITLVVGAIVVVLLNLNGLTIGRTLYTENAVSTAVSAVAAKATNCSSENNQDCLANLEGQLSAAAAAGLPIGWGTVRDCTVPKANCNWWEKRGITSRHGNSVAQVLLVLLGFLIMIISIVPGAQFWFGLLTKLNTLRATGPKPATTAGSS